MEFNKQIFISEQDQKWMELIESFVVENISDDLLTVSSIARHFNMSDSSLLRRFKRIFGITPTKYLQETKLNFSKELLERNNHRTVAEVAYKVGYKNAKSFTRSFKHRYGKVPSTFLIQNQY